MRDYLLEISNLKTHYLIYSGIIVPRVVGYIKAVDDVSFVLKKGEVLGVAGASGSGKSTLARTIMLLEKATSGSIIFKGKDLLCMKGKGLMELRKGYQMIFQNPYASLNPRMTVYDLIKESIGARSDCGRVASIEVEVRKYLDIVGIGKEAMKKYPHEFSGGQRQRLAIARSLAVRPRIIIADEAVSSLDVSIQAQILNLLKDIVKNLELGLIFITHNLGALSYIADEVIVMNNGKIVEYNGIHEVINSPKSEITQNLLKSMLEV